MSKKSASPSAAACTRIVTPNVVDLGLSVKWATFNLSAKKPEEYGYYYAWGETEKKENYTSKTYKWCNGNMSGLTKYCTGRYSKGEGQQDGRKTLEPSDDAAHAKLGGKWRMPTKGEMQELTENCTWTWTTINGTKGLLSKSNKPGYTDRSIFLPAAGYRGETGVFQKNSKGYYWSSSLDTEDPMGPMNASSLNFVSNDMRVYLMSRDYGLPIRPVYSKE